MEFVGDLNTEKAEAAVIRHFQTRMPGGGSGGGGSLNTVPLSAETSQQELLMTTPQHQQLWRASLKARDFWVRCYNWYVMRA